MNEPALTAQEVIAWLEKTSNGWRNLLTRHPELLAIPCDIIGVETVAQLLQHIVAVEIRYAHQLAGLPAPDYSEIPYDSVESLYATHDRAMALLQQLLASDINWNERIEYVTRTMGSARSARRSILFHLLFHGVRHYAQLATLARRHGIKPDWGMDYLLMDIGPV